MTSEVIRRRSLHRTLRRRESPAQRIRKKVESVCEFFLVDERKHSPGIGIVGRLLDRAFQCCSRWRMFLGTDALKMCEAAKHGFVRTQSGGIPGTECLTHAARQNAMGICDGRHNLGNDVIKQIKRSLIGKGTIIRFGPEMSS